MVFTQTNVQGAIQKLQAEFEKLQSTTRQQTKSNVEEQSHIDVGNIEFNITENTVLAVEYRCYGKIHVLILLSLSSCTRL